MADAARLIEEAFARRPGGISRSEDGSGRPLGRSFRVKLWPTLVFLKDGKEIERVVRPTDTGAIAAGVDAPGKCPRSDHANRLTQKESGPI